MKTVPRPVQQRGADLKELGVSPLPCDSRNTNPGLIAWATPEDMTTFLGSSSMAAQTHRQILPFAHCGAG